MTVYVLLVHALLLSSRVVVVAAFSDKAGALEECERVVNGTCEDGGSCACGSSLRPCSISFYRANINGRLIISLA